MSVDPKAPVPAAPPSAPGARAKLPRHEREVLAFWLRSGVSFVALMVAVAAVSVVAGYLRESSGFGGPSTSGPVTGESGLFLLLLGAGMAALGWAFWLTVAWWKKVDEAVRRAHLVGFFFGGTAGLCIATLLGSSLIGAQPLTVLWLETHLTSETEAFGFGALAAVVVILLGYLVGWAVWWLRVHARS
jgi:uncharacterized membrane protein YidH (DUF202 family)